MSRRRILSLTAIVAVTLCLTAPAQAAEPGGIDPCRIVTQQEVQALLGAPVAASVEGPSRPNGKGVRICNFRGKNGKMVNVYLGPKTKAGFESEKKGFKSIAGLGDDAYANPPSIVGVRKGEIEILVSAMGFDATPDDAAFLGKVTALARAAAGRL